MRLSFKSSGESKGSDLVFFRVTAGGYPWERAAS